MLSEVKVNPERLSLYDSKYMISWVSEWKSLSHVWLCDPMDCPWNSPGQNTGMDSCSLLQRIFPIQGSNPGLPHCRQILYCLSHRRSPLFLRSLSNTVENEEASIFNADSDFCSKCSHKFCFTSNVNVIWWDMRSVEVRAAIGVEEWRCWQQCVPCHSFLTSVCFLKNMNRYYMVWFFFTLLYWSTAY